MTRLVSVLFAVLSIAGCTSQEKIPAQPSDYEKYETACKAKNGLVSAVAVHWNFVEYKCISISEDKELLPTFGTP